MTKRQLWLGGLGLYVLLSTGGVFALAEFSQNNTKNLRYLTAHSGDYRADLVTTATKISAPEAESWWGGSFDSRSLPTISSFRIYHKKERVFLPLSAFTDIADVTSLEMTTSGKECHLFLQGADAGSSYRAEIVVRGTNVVSRVVRSGEFPQERWEKTAYSWIPDDGR